MAEERMQYSFMIRNPSLMIDDGITVKNIFDWNGFNENEFREYVSQEVKNISPTGKYNMEKENIIIHKEEGHFEYALFTFTIAGVKKSDLYAAANKNNYPIFESDDAFMNFIVGQFYSEPIKYDTGLGSYVNVTKIFETPDSTPQMMGFHVIFSPIGDFSERPSSGYVQVPKESDNIMDCIWPGFHVGMRTITGAIDSYFKYEIGKYKNEAIHYSPYLNDSRFSIFLENYFYVFRTVSSVQGNRISIIADDFSIAVPTFLSSDTPEFSKSSYEYTLVLETSKNPEEIKADMTSDVIKNKVISTLKSWRYDTLAPYLDKLTITEAEKKQTLNWFKLNDYYFATMTSSSLEISSYKIKEYKGKQRITLDIIFKYEIPYQETGFNAQGMETGLAITASVSAIILAAIVAVIVGMLYLIISMIIKNTPDDFMWVWMLALLVLVGWGGYILFRRIFKRKKK